VARVCRVEHEETPDPTVDEHDDWSHDEAPEPEPEPTLRVLVYSDDRTVRQQVRAALGRRPASDLPALEYVEVATPPMVVSQADKGGFDLLILDGEATPAQISAFLTGLRLKGETVDEITGFARAMRRKVTKVVAPAGMIVDSCGAGGDKSRSFNVSTAAAFEGSDGKSSCAAATASRRASSIVIAPVPSPWSRSVMVLNQIRAAASLPTPAMPSGRYGL